MPAWHALVLPPSIPPAFIHPCLAPSRPPQLPPRLSGKQLPLVTRLPATPWNGPHRRSFYLNGTPETLGSHPPFSLPPPPPPHLSTRCRGVALCYSQRRSPIGMLCRLHQIPSPRGGWRPTPGLSAPVHACSGTPRFHASSTLASLPAQLFASEFAAWAPRLQAEWREAVSRDSIRRWQVGCSVRSWPVHPSVRRSSLYSCVSVRGARPVAPPGHSTHTVLRVGLLLHQVGVRLLEGSLKASCLRLKER